MSSVSILRNTTKNDDAAHTPQLLTPRLGRGEVVRAEKGRADVRLESGAVVAAELALAFAYEPAEGDVALVIGDAAGHYVIGILHGTGKTTFDLPGDVSLRAQGKLRLEANDAVEIASPRVEIQAGVMSTIAGAVTERFQSLRQRVRSMLSVQAGESHTIVEGSSFAQSKSASILTEEKVSINGREVHLG